MGDREKRVKKILLVVSIALLIVGFGTPGLWPYQLPCCLVGGFLLGMIWD